MPPMVTRGQARPTLRDVAERAGVSVSTASLVFSGKGPVAEATGDRVRAAATGPLPLKTREAVDTDTPARSATSRSVGRA